MFIKKREKEGGYVGDGGYLVDRIPWHTAKNIDQESRLQVPSNATQTYFSYTPCLLKLMHL